MRLACAVVLALPALAFAQSSGGDFTMRKSALAHGARAAGGNFVAVGTLSQSIAAIQGGGPYSLTGGFHAPATSLPDDLFCDGFEASPCL